MGGGGRRGGGWRAGVGGQADRRADGRAGERTDSRTVRQSDSEHNTAMHCTVVSSLGIST